MSGEIDRRVAERDAADRRYNDALTTVDAALPSAPPPPTPLTPPDLDARGVRDGIVILPAAPPTESGWRGRLGAFVWRLVAPIFTRQQEYNTRVAEQLEQISEAVRTLTAALTETRASEPASLEAFVSFNSLLVQYLQQITPYIDTKTRVIDASLEEVRMAATAAQRAAVAVRREQRIGDGGHAADSGQPTSEGQAAGASRSVPDTLGSRYVGFEDLFRGSSQTIRTRQIDYADRFVGASDVLDLGCGRGEFLDLLR